MTDPLAVLKFWEPGRSFHGGLLGVLCAIFIFAKIHRRSFWAISDYIVPAVPIGIAAGRLGNWINGELWGRVTTVPWAVVFPGAGSVPRHPSPLYEFFLEGVLLFIILHYSAAHLQKCRSQATVLQKQGFQSALFLIGYGVLRMIAECFREPDWHQGFVLGGYCTQGQLLCIPMILGGLLILVHKKLRNPLCSNI